MKRPENDIALVSLSEVEGAKPAFTQPDICTMIEQETRTFIHLLMTDHDRLFKELLTTFFVEFVELFLPDVSEYLDPASIEFLDKEVFTDVTAGDSHEVDLVVRAKVSGQDAFFLIHVEHQSSTQAEFGKRMFRYFSRLHEKHDLPIYPVVLFSYDEPKRPEPDRFQVKVQDRLVLDFWYQVIQLNQLSWRDFARQHNPVASALMAKMKIATEDRVRVKLECLRLLTTLQLDPARERLISGFVGTYLELGTAEEQQYMAEMQSLPTKEKEGIMEIMTSWERKGLEQGLEQGLERGKKEGVLLVTLRLLRLRVGSLPESLEERLRQLSIEQLELLSEASFSTTTLSEVEDWLKAHS